MWEESLVGEEIPIDLVEIPHPGFPYFVLVSDLKQERVYGKNRCGECSEGIDTDLERKGRGVFCEVLRFTKSDSSVGEAELLEPGSLDVFPVQGGWCKGKVEDGDLFDGVFVYGKKASEEDA